jgi:hypothetical protein
LDVCEDAATFKQTSGTSYVNGGGAKSASDKILQHNGGGTVAVKNFYADTFGKVYRSCGNCETQYKRTSTFTNIHVKSGGVIAGVNTNYGGESIAIPGPSEMDISRLTSLNYRQGHHHQFLRPKRFPLLQIHRK